MVAGGVAHAAADHIFASGKLFADDTSIPVLDPGRGRTRTGRFWVYARDDRPWAGPDPPAVVFFYSPDCKAERPAAHFKGFRGVLQVDGGACPRAGQRPDPGAEFERLTVGGDIVLAACWAHTRRKFYEFHQATGSPIAAGVLRRIAELYAIERKIRGHSAEERQSTRDIRSRPLVDAMKPWLEGQLYRVTQASGKTMCARLRERLGDSLRCALTYVNFRK